MNEFSVHDWEERTWLCGINLILCFSFYAQLQQQEDEEMLVPHSDLVEGPQPLVHGPQPMEGTHFPVLLEFLLCILYGGCEELS